MIREQFCSNGWPTLGVEIELQLVDARWMGLRSAIAEILPEVDEPVRDAIKPEFMQCYVEINSAVGQSVADVAVDLDRKVRAVETIAARHDLRLLWAATHPFSSWRHQEITPNERYYKLADSLGETVVRPVTFGLHVHVGVESGDKAIEIGERLQRHLPALLALSVNSPFWNGRRTGHHAHRIELLEGFPTGGLPPRMHCWKDYETLVGQMTAAGFIDSDKELWWDVRPNATHGTVEVRICDMPANLCDVMGLSALIQCLVRDLGNEIDAGCAEPDYHPLLNRQNRWLASRHGLAARLVDPVTLEPRPARLIAEALVERLRDASEDLDCIRELEHVLDMAANPTGAEQQLAAFEETGDLREVVRKMVQQSQLLPAFVADSLSPREIDESVLAKVGTHSAFKPTGDWRNGCFLD